MHHMNRTYEYTLAAHDRTSLVTNSTMIEYLSFVDEIVQIL